jgi:hypothetical protein
MTEANAYVKYERNTVCNKEKSIFLKQAIYNIMKRNSEKVKDM